jgi:predicted helicase
MAIFTTKQYLNNISKYYQDPTSSEMSYRTDFQRFLEIIFSQNEQYHIQHDPKATSGNKPDFIVIKNGIPILYIEVKKIGEDLDKIEKSEQAARYFGYTNLIISDYLDFRFYRNGEKYDESISLGRTNTKTKSIVFNQTNDEKLIRTIKDFVLSEKEPIKSGTHLAKIMGGKAQRIRDNIIAYLNLEKAENQELIKIMNVIKEYLISDVDIRIFADIYAQTIVYGLFVARFNDKTPHDFSRQEARELVPSSNPFLQHFFDHIAGSSFPKRLDILVSELCEVFTHANVHSLMEDYYNVKTNNNENTETADPVIHFYEDFLLEYDPSKKMDMGVFYTPQPVVRFIIRSVDSILKNKFNVVKGLADNQKIQAEITNHLGKPISKEIHRIQILDIATGTGTFLNETIKFIYESFKGHEGKWSSYINEDLIPRLFGFEIMMASYTIAHLKLSMTLEHTGISDIQDRLKIYLTNTLDEVKEYSLQGTLFGFLDSIADESKSASRIKKEYPIMVVIGNPPYSGESMNPHYTDNDVYKFEPGGKIKLQEKNSKWLNDDYVKFIRFSESMIEKKGEGIIGMITAHGYIDNPTFRGMRWHLRKTFDEIYILDLHGNTNKKETSPDGSKDENVFDIKTGVAIIFGIKYKSDTKKKEPATIYFSDCYGLRNKKHEILNTNDISSIEWNKLPADSDIWRVEGSGKDEYIKGFSINELFTLSSAGIVTARDKMSIQFSQEDIENVIIDFQTLDTETLREKYNLGKDVRDWSVQMAINDIKNSKGSFIKLSYRPFDERWTYYTGNSKGFHCMPRENVMKHFLKGDNIGLVYVQRSPSDTPASYIFVSNKIISNGLIRSDSVSIDSLAPLYLYADDGEKMPNLKKEIWDEINKVVGETSPDDILNYIYASLFNPVYRNKYIEFLKSDYPRVPYPENKNIFGEMVKYGNKLRNLHLLIDPKVKIPITTFPVKGSNIVEKSKFENGNVYINKDQYFGNVPENVWNFYIGGYQPAQKYLKEYKNKTLTNQDIEHYEEIIVALSETISTMKEIENLF